MRVLIGFFILLIFYFLGQFVSFFIGGFMPGSIIGMILLFLALYFKLLDPQRVKDVSLGLTRNMAILFVPAGVGIIESFDLLKQYWLIIIVVSAISSILVIAIVSVMQEKLEHKKTKDQDEATI